MKQLSAVAKKLVQDTFIKQNLLVYLGAKITQIQYGKVSIFLPKTELTLQQHGFVHGGIISTLADTCSGLSAYTDLQHSDHSCITIEMKINFLRPADSDLVGVGKLIKANKSMMVTTGQILNRENKLCAYMLQTVKRNTPENSKFQEI